MTWTKFWDMHSGGGSKEEWNFISIEAPEKEAKIIFYNRFGHNPERVSCTCCGRDYSIDEYKTLEEIHKFLKEYDKNKSSLFIFKEEIKDDERIGEVPEQGYVWR